MKPEMTADGHVRLSNGLALTPDEVAAVMRWAECVEDSGASDVPAPMMKRLREIGILKHKGGGWHTADEGLLMEIEDLVCDAIDAADMSANAGFSGEGAEGDRIRCKP